MNQIFIFQLPFQIVVTEFADIKEKDSKNAISNKTAGHHRKIFRPLNVLKISFRRKKKGFFFEKLLS